MKELLSPEAPEGAGGSSSSFSVDARIGHAWFARPAKAPPPRRGAEMLPALRRAELVLAGQGRAIARRATRIPAEAIVGLGARLSAAPRPEPSPALAAGPAGGDSANDNVARSAGRTVLREVFFLLVFGATLAGTYYLGRLHGMQNIIVVPEPGSRADKIV